MSNPNSRPDHGRRIVLVDRRFQFKYAGLLGVLSVVLVLVGGAVAHLIHRTAADELDLPVVMKGELESWANPVLWTLVGVALLAGVLTAGLGLLVTHRIAGPIYAMTRSLSDLAQGRYPLLRPMRKGDELGDFFDLFRKSIDLLHTRDMEEAYKIEAAALALQPHCASKEAQSAVEVLQALAVQKRAQTRSAGEAPGVGGRG